MARNQDLGFDIPNFDWNAYVRFRPTYPASLFKQIYDYHAQHKESSRLVHDAGAGAGVASEVLAERFDEVALSDPNKDYVEAAKQRLGQLDLRAKLHFHVSPAEDQSWLSTRSLDAFTIFTAIGYANLERLMEELSRVMRPGATFAAVNYNGWPAILNNAEAAEAWLDFGDVWVRRGIMEGTPAVQRGFRVSWAGHDCIEMPEAVFEKGVVRIKINDRFRTEEDLVKRMPDLNFPTSKVGSADVVVNQEDLDSWARDYTVGDLKRFVETLAYTPEGPVAETLWRRVERALKESEVKTLQLQWSAQIILATRRVSSRRKSCWPC